MKAPMTAKRFLDSLEIDAPKAADDVIDVGYGDADIPETEPDGEGETGSSSDMDDFWEWFQ